MQTVTATTPSGSRPAVTAHPEQKLLAPRPLFTAAREVKTVVPVSSVTPVTPPRPLRTGEQTAALWIAPYIDNQDVYHQPSSVFFVIKPSAWGKPRINSLALKLYISRQCRRAFCIQNLPVKRVPCA